MSEQASKSRFAIDLDDLEKQLKSVAQPAKGAAPADPLAELARIVGKDDPLKALFADRKAPVQPVPQRVEPAFEPHLEAIPQGTLRGGLDDFEDALRRDLEAQVAPSAFEAAQPRRVVLDEDAFLEEIASHRDGTVPVSQVRHEHDFDLDHARGLDHARNLDPARGLDHAKDLDQASPMARDLDSMGPLPSDGGYAQSQAEQGMSAVREDQPDMRELTPRSGLGKGFIVAGSLLALGAVGIIGAFSFGGSSKTADGQPPMIKADTGPTKVAPANPGGTVVPDQNKQIYERTADTKPADAKMVNREEQPVDVQQAARAAPRVILPAAGSASATPTSATPSATASAPAPTAPAATSETPASVPGLGEPRRVRTVAIRPDGTAIAAPAAAASTPSAPATTASAPVVAPRPVVTAPAAVPVPRPRPPAAASDETAPLRISPNAQASKEQVNKEQSRVALAPATTPQPRPAPAPAAAAPASSGDGAFSVQLGAPGSEAEARSSFANLQRRFPDQLSGQSPTIRRADVSGRTVYRLRVGSLSREEAQSMCSQLQSAGGQCFVARN